MKMLHEHRILIDKLAKNELLFIYGAFRSLYIGLIEMPKKASISHFNEQYWMIINTIIKTEII